MLSCPQCFSIMCLGTLQASDSPVVLRYRVLLINFSSPHLHIPMCGIQKKKKSRILDDMFKPKMTFLLITDLFRLSGGFSEKLVCTCEDHPGSPANPNYSGGGIFFPITLSEKWYDISISTHSKGVQGVCKAIWELQQENSPGLWSR